MEEDRAVVAGAIRETYARLLATSGDVQGAIGEEVLDVLLRTPAFRRALVRVALDYIQERLTLPLEDWKDRVRRALVRLYPTIQGKEGQAQRGVMHLDWVLTYPGYGAPDHLNFLLIQALAAVIEEDTQLLALQEIALKGYREGGENG